MRQKGWRRFVKRSADVFCAATGLMATAPVLAVAAVGVYVTMGRPIFFTQMRPGLHAKPFRLIKLRTMSQGRDGEGRELDDAVRLTPFGRRLRSLSIDELPQLWNVCRGEMSLVGPRPLLMRYVPRYSPEQARRHEVLPGITGWAQVHGRNALSWETKFAHDVWYVENWSLALDARIIVASITTVLRRSGISSAGEATMAEFLGSQE